MALHLHRILQHIGFQDTAHPGWAFFFIKGDIEGAEILPPVDIYWKLTIACHGLGTSDSRPSLMERRFGVGGGLFSPGDE